MNQIRRKVLVAPFDWGLGHATRSIPIIRELQRRDCEVLIASSGDALVLLKKEFPSIQSFELPSYRATYSRYFPLIFKVFFQLPKFLVVIAKEHHAIERIVKQQQVHFLISDNRYGCWTKLVPTVFITHQINIQMPFALQWIQAIVNFFNHRQIRKFNHCWIPDFPENRLTGKLTEPGNVSVKFIGMLSRFNKVNTDVAPAYDYLALVSGPEPQRTIFERKVRLCFSEVEGRKIVVRGLPGLVEEIVSLGDLDEVSHLTADELQRIIEQSRLVICRSGYSSIMDVAALGKRALLIPTPGQTEQEYLGAELMKMEKALSVKQDSFSGNDLLRAEGYTGFLNGFSMDLLKKEIDAILRQCIVK
ncbi:MAG: glycosyltransferase [Bacteroidota bacterium]